MQMTARQLDALYDRDPRREWTPSLSHFLGWQPWEMLDLTPMELDAGVKAVASG